MSLNGTGTKALQEQQTAILRHLRQAREAMAEAVPNLRDYCHLSNAEEAYQAAYASWQRDYAALDSLMTTIAIVRQSIGMVGYR